MDHSRRTLLLTHPKYRPDVRGARPGTELDVYRALKRAGHEVGVVTAVDDPRAFDARITDARPDVVFNLLEEFRGEGVYDFHLVSHLEALGVPCTGCNPRGLILSRNKYLVTATAAALGIPVPATTLTTAPSYPAFVKYNREHASRGITRANVVRSPRALKATRTRMRGGYDGEVVVQSFIAGAEVSVSVLGNARPRAFVPWRLHLGDERVATEKMKFDANYRRRLGVRAGHFGDVDRGRLLIKASLRLFKALELSGYARFDFRCPAEGPAYLIDVNANPNLARGEDFAQSAARAGVPYQDVLNQIISLAERYRPRR